MQISPHLLTISLLCASTILQAAERPGYSGRLIDCHMHTGNWEYHWSTDDLAPILRKEGITFALVSALESPPSTQVAANNAVLAEVAKHPDLFGALAWAHPLENGWREDLERTLRAGRCYGIKIHPARYQYKLDSFPAILRGVFEVARAHRLPIVTHTDEQYSPPKNFLPLIEEFRDVTLVLYHSYPMIDSISIAATHPNVYLDNSWIADSPEFVLVAVRALGSRRVLYGTDAPVSFEWNPTKPLPPGRLFFARPIDYISGLPLTQKQKEDIFFRNAERVFHIQTKR